MNQESYRLDYIAQVELGQKKLDHSEFDTFKDFYNGNWKKFVDYNIIDVELVDRLEDKLRLIELVVTMAFDAKVNFVDPMFQVRGTSGVWVADGSVFPGITVGNPNAMIMSLAWIAAEEIMGTSGLS